MVVVLVVVAVLEVVVVVCGSSSSGGSSSSDGSGGSGSGNGSSCGGARASLVMQSCVSGAFNRCSKGICMGMSLICRPNVRFDLITTSIFTTVFFPSPEARACVGLGVPGTYHLMTVQELSPKLPSL